MADALNLTIHNIESNPTFASVTNISSVSSETDATVKNIGHLEEEAMANNVICDNQPAQLTMDHCKLEKIMKQ